MIRKQIFALGLTLLAFLTYAQDGEMRGIISTDNFPEVSFMWHEYNPSPLKNSAFELREDGKNVDCHVIRETPTVKGASRTIVILWEDMYCNSKMFPFVQQVLVNFIDSANLVQGKDYVCIAAFNRHRNSEQVLKPVTDGFVTSRSRIRQDISNYQHSTETYSELPNQSDVYPAILEALELLQKRDDDEVKGVFVLTAGRPLESSATNSAVEVQKRSKETHIPLYIYQYAAAYGKSTKLEGLGNDTYGSSVVFEGGTSDANIRYAATVLTIGYRHLPTHYYGQDYKIAYHSNLQRGGKEVVLDFKVNSQLYTFSITPAKHTFGTWCKAYWYICLILFVVLVGLIVLIVLYVQKQKKQHAADEAALGQLKNEHAQSQQQMQNQLNEQAARIEQYKAQETMQRVKRKEDSQSMLELMRSKNVYPRIQYSDSNNNMHVFEMQKPEILIGRGSEADLRLDNPTVSRKHAKISFVGGGFEIVDLGSSNGTIVAGRPVQKSAMILNNHDIINLGTALMTFYM